MMDEDYEVRAALAPSYAAAERAVANDPELAEWRARAADEEAGRTPGWLARNMLALQVEMRMPSIPQSVVLLREHRRKQLPWWRRLLGLTR